MALLHSLMNQQSIFNPFPGLIFSENVDTQMDWKETPHVHIFKFDLPGLTREDVKVEVHEGRTLHLSAERKQEPEEKGEKWHCKERTHHGSFTRQFRLPEDAKVDEIKASMRDGVLVVNVPKDERKKKKCKHKSSVEISGEEEEGQRRKGFGRFVCCKA